MACKHLLLQMGCEPSNGKEQAISFIILFPAVSAMPLI